MIPVVVVLVTFIVIDNAYLDVVMQQPDKANGFRQSGMHSARDYVNQGNFGILLVLPFFGGVGAFFGTLGGLIRSRIDLRLARPAVTV